MPQVLRTLAPEDFDRFVDAALSTRQRRRIEATNQKVTLLPYFADKLRVCRLYSSIHHLRATFVGHRGRAHMALKDSSRPRRTKEECARAKELERMKVQQLEGYKFTETALGMRGLKVADLPRVLEQAEQLANYAREKTGTDPGPENTA
mgnify:CR=1 FL=1